MAWLRQKTNHLQCVLKLSSSRIGIINDHMRGIKGDLIIY